MAWTNEQAYQMWKATLKGDEGNCGDWLRDKGNQYYDKGGLTHWGVTRGTWLMYAKKNGWGTSVEAQCGMTETQFDTITRSYWRISGANLIDSPGVAILAVMMVWGTGLIYPLQRALQKQGFKIMPDGVFGRNTQEALQYANKNRLIADIKPDWINTLLRTTDSRYHIGLKNRVERIYKLVNAAEKGLREVEYMPGKILTVPPSGGQMVGFGWVFGLAAGLGYLAWKRFSRGNKNASTNS